MRRWAPLARGARGLALLSAIGLLLLTMACSSPNPTPATSGDELLPGRPVLADLDGDGADETVLFGADECLLVEDGSTTYRTREQWEVVQAFLGDTDGNGLQEITALLDDARGRHLGLIAWMGDRYRERIVTSVLTPRPLALEVVPGTDHDLVILDEERSSAPGGVVRTTYRWNGFGFTAVGVAAP